MSSKRVPTRLTVNPAVCDGFGFCCEILPEMIRRDEWGFPLVESGAIPERLTGAAEQAVRFCPRRALAIVGTGG